MYGQGRNRGAQAQGTKRSSAATNELAESMADPDELRSVAEPSATDGVQAKAARRIPVEEKDPDDLMYCFRMNTCDACGWPSSNLNLLFGCEHVLKLQKWYGKLFLKKCRPFCKEEKHGNPVGNNCSVCAWYAKNNSTANLSCC